MHLGRTAIFLLCCISGIGAVDTWLSTNEPDDFGVVDSNHLASVSSSPTVISQPSAAVNQWDAPIENGLDRKTPLTDIPKETPAQLKLTNGLLSIHVAERSLVSILEELASSQREINIVIRDKAIDRAVTMDMEAVPIEQGLRRLLNTEDMIMLYGNQAGAESALEAVVVYPKGEGSELVFSESERAFDSADSFTHALDTPDEKVRAQTVESLVQRYGAKAQDLVLRALKDSSDRVRKQALRTAVSAALPLPVDTVAQLAMADRLTSVRLLAIETLPSYVEGPDRDSVLRTIRSIAETDPEPKVKEKASQILSELNQAGVAAAPGNVN